MFDVRGASAFNIAASFFLRKTVPINISRDACSHTQINMTNQAGEHLTICYEEYASIFSAQNESPGLLHAIADDAILELEKYMSQWVWSLALA